MVQNERPDAWDSEGSVHSIASARSYHPSGADEYDDIYTNVSTKPGDWSQSKAPSPMEIIIYFILSHRGTGPKLHINILLNHISVGLGPKYIKLLI